MCEGLVLLASAQGAYVGRIIQDNAGPRMAMMHHIPSAPGARQGILPYAAWRLRAIDPSRAPRSSPNVLRMVMRPSDCGRCCAMHCALWEEVLSHDPRLAPQKDQLP